jgi:hypothetical protein
MARVTDIGVWKIPIQFIKFLCMTLKLECGVCNKYTQYHRSHIFLRNKKLLPLQSVDSDTILQSINKGIHIL